MKIKFFLVLTIAIFLVYLISAAILPLTFSMDPNVNEDYVITIDNDDIFPDGNITIVNITVPAGLVYIDESNTTTSSYATFLNNSNFLIWENSSDDGYLINGTNSKTFGFTANGSTLDGVYNVTILVIANATHSVKYNSTVTIEDTTKPSISFRSPTPISNSNIAQTFIPANVTATDEVAIDTMTIFIYGSSGLLVSGSDDVSPFFLNFTGLVDGVYTVNATVNDTSGNTDKTTRIITLNASSGSTACSPNWGNCTSWSTCLNQNQTRTCSDLNICNTTTNNKQNQTQTCGEAAPTICTPNWDCGDWKPAKCKEGETQEKLCVDLNECYTDNEETTIRNCVVEGSSSLVWIASIGGVILFIIIAVTILYIRGRMKLGSELSSGGSKTPPVSMPKINFPRRQIRIPRLPRRPPMNAPAWASKKPLKRRGPLQRTRRPPPRRENFQNKPL